MKKLVKITPPEDETAIFTTASAQERRDLVCDWFDSLDESQVSELLSEFCTESRETYDDNADISDISFDNHSSGLIEIDFTGSAYYGCKDANRSFSRSATISFSFSDKEKTIAFSSDPPDPMDRSPDDEF